MLAVQDFPEALDGVLERDVFARAAGERFGDEERLGKETLDLARAVDGLAVGVRKFFNAQNRNDVLQFFVALERLLDVARHIIMFAADDLRIKRA